ncbi:cytochrome c-type biogenesis CcmF C-terminal domain-containing protein, partial [Mesorhizobium sp. M1E.F.Ca.ET.041.01.1.1]
PFFDLTFGPLMLPLLAIVPFGPLLAWKRGDVLAASQRLMAAFALAIAAMLVTGLFIDGGSVFAALGVGLAVWLVAGALTDLAVKSGVGSVTPAVILRRFAGLPRSVFGTALAHLGLGLTLLGIVGTLSFGTEKILTMRAGETVDLSGHTLRFEGLFPRKGPNFTEDRGRFLLISNGNADGEITSAKRFYPARQTVTTESGIRTLGLSQLYLSLGDEGKDGSVVVRLWWKPLVTLIWGGGLVMMAGAAMSLLDRRLRVGAPARRRKPAAAAASASAT